jgi:Amidase
MTSSDIGMASRRHDLQYMGRDDRARCCGSGVAVGTGMVPTALGTNTGGLMRLAAALCGTLGLKTMVDQVSRAGVLPLRWTCDAVRRDASGLL